MTEAVDADVLKPNQAPDTLSGRNKLRGIPLLRRIVEFRIPLHDFSPLRDAIEAAEAAPGTIDTTQICALSELLLAIPAAVRSSQQTEAHSLESRGYRAVGSLLKSDNPDIYKEAWRAVVFRWLKAGLVVNTSDRGVEPVYQIPGLKYFTYHSLSEEIRLMLRILESPNGVSKEELIEYWLENQNPFNRPSLYKLNDLGVRSPAGDVSLIEVREGKYAVTQAARAQLRPHLPMLTMLAPKPDFEPKDIAYARALRENFAGFREKVLDLVTSEGFDRHAILLDNQVVRTFFPRWYLGPVQEVPFFAGDEFVIIRPRRNAEGKIAGVTLCCYEKEEGGKDGSEEKWLGLSLGAFKHGRPTRTVDFNFKLPDAESMQEIYVKDYTRSQDGQPDIIWLTGSDLRIMLHPFPIGKETSYNVSLNFGIDSQTGSTLARLLGDPLATVSIHLSRIKPTKADLHHSLNMSKGLGSATVELAGETYNLQLERGSGTDDLFLEIRSGEDVATCSILQKYDINHLLRQLSVLIERIHTCFEAPVPDGQQAGHERKGRPLLQDLSIGSLKD